jgi:hypothetical protein
MPPAPFAALNRQLTGDSMEVSKKEPGYVNLGGPVIYIGTGGLGHVRCGSTITIALIWFWAVSTRSSIWPWLHNRTACQVSANWGD